MKMKQKLNYLKKKKRQCEHSSLELHIEFTHLHDFCCSLTSYHHVRVVQTTTMTHFFLPNSQIYDTRMARVTVIDMGERVCPSHPDSTAIFPVLDSRLRTADTSSGFELRVS